MQAHKAAEIFPLLTGPEFDSFVADIRENGLREPIVVHNGEILDGRNRFRACEEIGIEPVTVEWDHVGTPEAFVISMNLYRRHLNESQRAEIGAHLATRTRQENLIPGGVKKLDLGIHSSSMTVGEAARLLNVSPDSVHKAKIVLKEGTAEEIEAVRRGDASVHTIAKQIRKGQSPEKRKARRDEALAQTGKNPERIQRQQMHAELWARLSDALLGLTSLPLPSDVAEIVAGNVSRRRVVDDRLSRSLQWLKDFEHEWRNRGQAAAQA